MNYECKTINISDDEKVFVRIEKCNINGVLIRYQYDNHLGSACLELNENGEIISYEEYHPFGTTSYRSGRSEIEVSLKRYKYCGKEKDEETGLYYYGARYYAARLCRFVSVDPLNEQYPELSAYQYASNRPITGIDLDGLEYINAAEARIIMRGEDVHINLDNFNRVTRNAWKQRNENPSNWSDGNIGFSTSVGSFIPPEISQGPSNGPANMDSGYGAIKPGDDPTQHKVQNPKAASTGHIDKRFSERTVSGASPGMARGAAAFVFVVNAINWSLNLYGGISLLEDINLVEEHTNILRKNVVKDINSALELGMVPSEYQNYTDLGNIANVVLMGVNITDNPEIYDIGINIVKEISGNYQPKQEEKQNKND